MKTECTECFSDQGPVTECDHIRRRRSSGVVTKSSHGPAVGASGTYLMLADDPRPIGAVTLLHQRVAEYEAAQTRGARAGAILDLVRVLSASGSPVSAGAGGGRRLMRLYTPIGPVEVPIETGRA